MFYVLIETYLKPTDGARTYGSVEHSIEEHEEPPEDRNYNNIEYCYSEGYDTEEEAEEALEEMLGDDFGVALMSPSQTENWLYEAIQEAVNAGTTDAEIEDLLDEWDSETRDLQEPETIDFDIARGLCEKRRQEAIDDDDDDDD